MSEPTKFYRAYHLTPGGHIARVELVEAVDDLAALRKLKTMPNRYGVELWDRARVVGKATPYKPSFDAGEAAVRAMSRSG